MGQKSSSLVEGHRPSEHVTLGVLARVVPVDLVDAVLRETGRQNWRARQLLPRVVVYHVMALTLYAHASYDAVLRELVEGLRWLHWDAGIGVQVGHHPGPGAPGRSPIARTLPADRPAAG